MGVPQYEEDEDFYMALIDRDQRPVCTSPELPIFASSARKQPSDVHVFIASRLLRVKLDPINSLHAWGYVRYDDIVELVNTDHKCARKM